MPENADKMSRTPTADRIRQRLVHARRRFHANDNIADFIEPGELDLLQREVQAELQSVLETLVVDLKSDHNTEGTAGRVAKMFIREVFQGRYTPMPSVTEFPNIGTNELMIVGPVTVRSACSHHLCPIIGKRSSGSGSCRTSTRRSSVCPASPHPRLVGMDHVAAAIQEEAVVRLADLLQQSAPGRSGHRPARRPLLHAVARREGPDSKMVNSVMRGSFLKNPDLRREFLSLLNESNNS